MTDQKLIVKQAPRKEFDVLPQGQYPCVCTAIVDLGTHDATWQGQTKKKHSIRFTFTFPTKTYKTGEGEERPFQLFVTHTLSLSTKGNLRPFLESWRGEDFDEDEILDGVDMYQFLGKTMLANVGHTTKGEDTYVNIISQMPIPEGMPTPEYDGELIFYTVQHHDENAFKKLSVKTQEKIMAADEMQIGSGSSSGPKSVHDYSPDKNRPTIEEVPF